MGDGEGCGCPSGGEQKTDDRMDTKSASSEKDGSMNRQDEKEGETKVETGDEKSEE